MSTSPSAVEIVGATLRYYTPAKEVIAVEDIDLDVRRGEFVAIVGSSGCGKSTLLSMIAGLTLPTTGSVRVDGRAVTAPSAAVGYMFQRDTLLEWRTIRRNVMLGAEQLGLDRRAASRRAEALLGRYGLGDVMDALPSQLSGGMRQRVALARTLCTDPDILLLDEPFSALDFQTRLSLSDEIVEILRQAGKTAVLVTHDIGEAVSMAQRVVVMSRRPGRIKAIRVIEFPSFGPGRPTPFEARSCPEFNGYFTTIWDELDARHVD